MRRDRKVGVDNVEGLTDDPYLFETSITPQLNRSQCVQLVHHIRDWAPSVLNADPDSRLELEHAARWLDSLADAVAIEQDSSTQGQFGYDAARLVQTLRVSRFLRNDTRLHRVIASSLDITFEGLFHESVKTAIINGEGRFRLPSKFTKQRGRLYLDVALILVARDRNSELASDRIGWADGSSQLTREWLHACTEEFEASKTLGLFIDRCELVAERQRRQLLNHARRISELHLDSSEDPDRIVRANRRLVESVHKHQEIPAAMGANMTNLACKAAALLWVYMFRCCGQRGSSG